MQKKQKIWWWIRLSLYILLAVALVRFYFRVTDDFRIGNMTYEMPFNIEWAVDPLTTPQQVQLDTILQQKFHYLGKGAQSYAFTSDDGKYVLKFFKFKHLRPSFLATLIPNIRPFSEYYTKEELRKKRKLNSVFIGYKLAYDLNKDESGILFVQLNPTHISKNVTLIDKIGLERPVDLGTVVYVVQEKGVTLRNTLTALLNDNDLPLAQQRINQIFDLYMSEYNKGIYDRDHGVMHNTGFVGNKPIHLDVGKLTADENIRQPSVYKEDLVKVANKIELWLRTHYPEHYGVLVPEMEKKLTTLFGQEFHFTNK